MNMEAFLKKNMKRIVRLEKELDKLFVGTEACTNVQITQRMYRNIYPDPKFGIQAWVDDTDTWYYLDKFPNMTAMIGQIKHDVKRVRKEESNSQ